MAPPKIIAAAKADESTGAVVYWTMSGPCAAAALADAWAAAGLDPAWLPIDAMRALVNGGMQPSVRHLAKRMIPHIMDWCHEQEIWDQINNVPLAAVAP